MRKGGSGSLGALLGGRKTRLREGRGGTGGVKKEGMHSRRVWCPECEALLHAQPPLHDSSVMVSRASVRCSGGAVGEVPLACLLAPALPPLEALFSSATSERLQPDRVEGLSQVQRWRRW